MDTITILFQFGLLTLKPSTTTTTSINPNIPNNKQLISIKVPNESTLRIIKSMLIKKYKLNYNQYKLPFPLDQQKQIANELFINRNHTAFENWIRKNYALFPSRVKNYLSDGARYSIEQAKSHDDKSTTNDSSSIILKDKPISRYEIFYHGTIYVSLSQLCETFIGDNPDYNFRPSIDCESDTSKGYVDLIINFDSLGNNVDSTEKNAKWYIDFGVVSPSSFQKTRGEDINERIKKFTQDLAIKKANQAKQYALAVNMATNYSIDLKPIDEIYAIGIGVAPANIKNLQNDLQVEFSWIKI